jgi:hypothetical protein
MSLAKSELNRITLVLCICSLIPVLLLQICERSDWNPVRGSSGQRPLPQGPRKTVENGARALFGVGLFSRDDVLLPLVFVCQVNKVRLSVKNATRKAKDTKKGPAKLQEGDELDDYDEVDDYAES